jgi:hypothetical protein
MKSILHQTTRAEISNRLKSLNENSTPLWGKMNVSEMLAHMNDAMRLALGMKEAVDSSNFISNKIVFPIAVYLLPFWPKGNPTAPEMIASKKGTAPKDFYTELGTTLKLIDVIIEREENKLFPHHMFGKLSKKQWGDLLAKHFDHHLKQFGV